MFHLQLLSDECERVQRVATAALCNVVLDTAAIKANVIRGGVVPLLSKRLLSANSVTMSKDGQISMLANKKQVYLFKMCIEFYLILFF